MADDAESDAPPRPSFTSARSDKIKRKKSTNSAHPTIALKDNTGDLDIPPEVTPTRSSTGGGTANGLSAQASPNSLKPNAEFGIRHSRGESLRIALGQGKYKKWSEQEYEELARKRTKRVLSKAGSRASTDISVDATTDVSDEDSPKPQEEEIDVLYENQRGSFIFGIPLFSSRTLLNFDPSPWTHQNGKDSAVNISNAQLPDPSWQWAWKNWYIDMGGDVDDNGWQYSFSFSKWFSWHGTHVFFNSFVRRRRWVRKRTRNADRRLSTISYQPVTDGSELSSQNRVQNPHQLNPDYFSIHSENRKKRDDRNALKRAVGNGTLGGPGWGELDTENDNENNDEELKNVPQLMRALRIARLDREKIAAVERFATEGGEEVHYLAERMPEILNLLLFQSSRRQLVTALQRVYDSVDHPSVLSSPKTPKSPHPLSILTGDANDGTVLSPVPASPAPASPHIKITSSSQESLPLKELESHRPQMYDDSPQVSPMTARPNISKYKSSSMHAYKTSLKIAIESAETSLKKLEFWSEADDNTGEISNGNGKQPAQAQKVWKGKERAL